MSDDPIDRCEAEFLGRECHRESGHGGKHQAPGFEDDGEYGLQLLEWWSIKPNGDPVETAEKPWKVTRKIQEGEFVQ